MIEKQTSRRLFLAGVGGAVLAGALAGKGWAMDINTNFIKKKAQSFPYSLPDEEWQQKLAPDAYKVLRENGTEPPNSSPLNTEKRKGTFYCAGCGAALFSSDAKYESGTGWPSFYQPVSRDAVDKSTDFKIIVPRTEVHCANCGGHLGHVFDDGPAPTGLRYCMNGDAMTFKPAE